MTLRVRERPPLRHSIGIQAPNGRSFRWGEDEPRPENVFSGLRHSSTAPGGFESCDLTLPRKPGIDYADLEPLSTVTVYSAGGEVVGEFRLERAPRTSGSEMSVSPGCVGWQAALEDDKSVRVIYVDRQLDRWQGPSAQRRVDLLAANFPPSEHTTDPGQSGPPSLVQVLGGAWGPPYVPIVESWYDAGEVAAGLYYEFDQLGGASGGPWTRNITAADDELHNGSVTLATLGGSSSGAGYVAPGKRWIRLVTFYNATPAGAGGGQYGTGWRPAVYGNHGLQERGSDPGGFFDSEMVAHAVGRWAPILDFTEGVDGTVRPSGFVVPHSAFHDLTTVGEIVRQNARFQLPDWGVWEDKTFWYVPRNSTGRTWRARVGPARLEETGPQVDRIWNSIVVAYRDVDGTTRTVGPPGSDVDTESDLLEDLDPDNPANRLGIVRRDLLQMGISTAAGAAEVGRTFLEQAKLLDTSGRATLVGHVEDERGVLHPYSHVRAMDRIIFVDAASPGERHVIRADHNHESRSCSVDLDSPPEGLAALLERLNVVLVPLAV